MLVDYLSHCADAVVQVADRQPIEEYHLKIAGVCLRLRIAGAALAAATLPALAHLLSDEEAPAPAITLHLWDGAATGVWPPRPPFTPDDYRRYGQRAVAHDGRHSLMYAPTAGQLFAYDRASRQGYFWAADAGRLSIYERAAPVQTLFHWALGEFGWQIVFCFAADCQSVYNPFSLLLMLKQKRFGNFWFDTDTPTFLIKLIERRGYDVRELDNLELSDLAFSAYDLDELPVTPLLYQTGYLTIKGYDPASRLYRLGYPNYKVAHAFLTYLLAAFTPADLGAAGAELWRLAGALRAADFDRVFAILRAFFAGIPYDIQMPQERYYQTVFYLIFRLLGLQTGVEVRSSRGRADAVVDLAEGVFIFEFKLEGTPADALAQIRRQGYAEPYGGGRKPVYLIGVRFDLAQRTIVAWEVARG